MGKLTSASLDPLELTAAEILRHKKDAVTIREITLQMIFQARSGHPGGSLSAVNVLVALYGVIMRHRPESPNWEDRDYFLLSKGHAAPALYATLAHHKYFNSDLLYTLRQHGSLLQGHPVTKIPGVECSTGALGMGLPVSVGIALGLKMEKKPSRVHVLLGDGECQEGTIWEAAMAAAHYHLDNLVAVVDRNSLQIDGPTEKVMGLEPLSAKWESFGWHVIEIDGTELEQVIGALLKAKTLVGRPTVIIAYLVKGAGVPFMEHVLKFHGTAPSEKEYQTGIALLKELKEQLKEQGSKLESDT